VERVGDGQGLDGVSAVEVLDDRGQVGLGEAPGQGGHAQGPVDRGGADEGGQLDGARHLGTDARHPGRTGLPQPALGSVAQGQEGSLSVVGRPQWPLLGAVAGLMVGIVLIDDARLARSRQPVAGDLGQALGTSGHDDQLLARHPAPHLVSDVALGRGVAHRAPADRLVVAHQAGLAQRRGVGLGGQHVQPGPLLGQHLRRRPVRLGVGPDVDPLAELRTGRLQGGKVGILLAQVGRGRHQVGLGHPHRRLHPALGLGVIGHAALHHHPVVAAGGHHLRVAHGQARHPVDGDRALVVAEQVGGGAAELGEGGVDAGQQGAQRAVPGGQHHPEAAPGQPGAEQQRRPAPHRRALAPVELQPHSRLGHPRPIGAAAAGEPRRLGLGHGPASGALVADEAHGQQVLMDHVGADVALGALDELLDLLHEGIDDALPTQGGDGDEPGVAPAHVELDGLGVAAGQTAGGFGAAGQVKRFEDLHDLPVRLRHGLPPVVGT